MDRLRPMRCLPAWRRQSVPRDEEPRRVLEWRLRDPHDRAASEISARSRQPLAGARRAARLLGRDHVRCVEESGDAEERADGYYWRWRARPDVPRVAPENG